MSKDTKREIVVEFLGYPEPMEIYRKCVSAGMPIWLQNPFSVLIGEPLKVEFRQRGVLTRIESFASRGPTIQMVWRPE